MTSEIVQLSHSCWKCLISCKSLNRFRGSTMCKSIERTTVINKATKTGCRILLRVHSMVLNGSVQFTFFKKAFVLSWLGGTVFSDGLYTIVRIPSDLKEVSHGVEEVWYFTNAMAASSLQNSSNTITPSSNVMWSIIGPSGSKPSNRFLTNSSLGVKS